ncbi:MAG: GNAT family N-acetyltransferase [Syntrophales bacterium]|jgi:acyl-CoA hydrolase/RimJ/RimL family protein N-acetyltransferase|nr:GNAT family N-acetyltransferase [Syntrophales bacterium]
MPRVRNGIEEPMGSNWKEKVIPPEKAIAAVEPGMSIFLGTGTAEPRTLVRHLMASAGTHLQDLELIQLVSLGDTVSIDERYANKYRLKTFFSGWIASQAIREGRVDLVPSRFSRIPWLFKSGVLRIDAAFIQVSPPDESGFVSLGVGVDVSRYAIEKASLVVGEINEQIPYTLGDTLVHVDDFDFFVNATEPPLYVPRWPVDEVFHKIAANVASVVEDGSCISFAIGPLYEALGKQLQTKRDLGIHTPFFTDAIMELVRSGAVTNRRKQFFRGKSLASYALGTAELLHWLDRNPFVEFQPLDVVSDPKNISLNDGFVGILPARKADLTGNIALHIGRGNMTAAPGAVQELYMGAALSRNGRTIFALPSRNRKGAANIMISIEDFPYQFPNRESLDMIATEYGVAYLRGRTVRERAQALIEIAHPDDRAELVRQAKGFRILYQDQIYLAVSGHMYPGEIACAHIFKGGLPVRFRAIKPSDEEGMRRLFYRFSDRAVYYRYFSPIKAMPHGKMQEYVNVDYRRTMSVVGVIEEEGQEKIIAEARYVRSKDRPYADTAFIVDEAYQGRGIASFLFMLLIKKAREEGIEGFSADVLADNKAMLKVYERSPYPVRAVLEGGIYELSIPFTVKNAADKVPPS